MGLAVCLFGLLVVGGVLGGGVGYLSGGAGQRPGTKPGWRDRGLAALAGAAAGLVLPVFLKITESRLLDQVTAFNNESPIKDRLVLFGMAILAGYAARPFMGKLAETLVSRAEQARVAAEEARTDVTEKAEAIKDEVAEQVEDLAGTVDELADAGGATVAAAAAAPDPRDYEDEADRRALAGDERKVFLAFPKSSYRLRSVSGLVRDSALPRAAVIESLGTLIDKRLVEGVKGPRTHRTLYRLASPASG